MPPYRLANMTAASNIIDLNPSSDCVAVTIFDYTMATIAVPKSDLPITFNLEEASHSDSHSETYRPAIYLERIDKEK
jgi:hypothetical protein